MNKAKKKFKAIEKDALDAPVKDIPWEGEEIGTESSVKLSDDQGFGAAVILKFFEFGANPETFAMHKPTAQEIFNSHIKGIESILWRDNLKPYLDVEPRLMFSKDKTRYRIIIGAVPMRVGAFDGKTRTLSQLLTNTP